MIREKGTDEWFNPESIEDWVAPQYRDKGVTYRRERDTMDVWFDSGTSWSMIPPRPTSLSSTSSSSPSSSSAQSLRSQADIYLEGTDQHRGWFQSSLLTSLSTQSISPFKTLITHGFVLDKDREKMSKSLGNVISPKEIVQGRKDGKLKGGVDGLRMWVAQSEYTTDVAVSETVLGHVLGGLQKIRATLRYLIGNLEGFSGEEVEYEMLSKVIHSLMMFTTLQGFGEIIDVRLIDLRCIGFMN